MVKTKLKCAGGTNQGLKRHNNEDAFHIDAERGIFLVVDGIGGQNAGERAAQIAVDRVRARLERQTGTAEQRVREAIAMANKEILAAAQTRPEWEGMACVLTVALLDEGLATVGHVGDSRLYHLHEGSIRKVTHDHSPVGEREDSGDLTELEAMHHPRRNEVYRDVGSEPHEPGDPDFIEIRQIEFGPSDALLLCSDGLSDQVPSAEIRRALERHAGQPQRAIEELIAEANHAGGKDNVTVVVVEGDQFTGPAPAKQEASASGPVLGRAGFFIAGLLVAGLAAWISRPWWVPPPVVIRPAVLQVGAGGQFQTIGAALAQASNGDVVEVAAGEYREQVQLKNGVTLRSHVPLEAVLRASAMGSGPAVTADGVNGARLEGFSILGDAALPLSAGIVLTNSTVAVEDNQVAGAGIGIEIRGEASPVLSGNTVRDCAAEGVLIHGASRPWMWHNVIQGNKGPGLAAREGAKPVLAGNIFERNTLELPQDISQDEVKQRNFLLGGTAVPRARTVDPARAAPAASKSERKGQ